MASLFEFFFIHFNDYMPILHRPAFENHVKDGLHLRDRAFGGVVALVCANGSVWSQDPRVLENEAGVPGWQWFQQVEAGRWSLLERPRLEDLQSCAVSIVFCAQHAQY